MPEQSLDDWRVVLTSRSNVLIEGDRLRITIHTEALPDHASNHGDVTDRLWEIGDRLAML
jgi:hypothetical protein